MAKYYTDPTTGQRVEIKKTHKFRNFVVLPVAGIFAVVLIANAASGNKGPATAGNGVSDASTSSGHHVVYNVEGSGQSNNITYVTNASMGMAQANGESLPWQHEVTMDSSFAPLSLSAQNAGSGTISCTITVDGKVITENHSSGPYAVVTCNGSL